MSWTLLVATAAHSCHRQRTALLQRSQGRRRGGVDQRLLLLPLDGVVLRRHLLVPVGEVLLRPVEEALGGVQVQVLGHHPQQVGGEPTQRQRQVRGVQEAAAGEPVAAQLETPVGAAPIHSRRKAVGTCDARTTGSIISQAVLPISCNDQRVPISSKTVIVRTAEQRMLFPTKTVDRGTLDMRFCCINVCRVEQEAFETNVSKYEIVALVRDQSRALISISSGAASVWAVGIDGPAAGRTLIEGSTGLRGK